MIEKKRVSLTLSFVPSQPVLTSDKKLNVHKSERDKQKELIRERLFELEQFRRSQLNSMKKRKFNVKKQSKLSLHTLASDPLLDERPLEVYQVHNVKSSVRKHKQPRIRFTKLDFDPELLESSKELDIKIESLVNTSKLLANKVKGLQITKHKPQPKLPISSNEIESNEMSYISDSYISHLNESTSSMRIKNITYNTNKHVTAATVLKSKNMQIKSRELPHSTSVSDLGSISDGEEIIQLPPLPSVLLKKEIVNATPEVVVKQDAPVIEDIQDVFRPPSLTDLYYDFYDSNLQESPTSVYEIPLHKPTIDKYDDPKALIFQGLEQLLQYELKTNKDTNEILSLLKTILETKKLVNEFTSPDISEFTQTSIEQLNQQDSGLSPSPATADDFESINSDISSHKDTVETSHINTVKSLDSIQEDPESSILIEDIVQYNDEFEKESSTSQQISEQIDSLINSALKVDSYASDFESLSKHDSTDTSVVNNRVTKLRTEIEDKLKDQDRLKKEADVEKKERKRKMKEQESQLKDRLAQIEDSIAEMLNNNFLEPDSLNSLDALESFTIEQKKELDVFEVEKNIEDIVV